MYVVAGATGRVGSVVAKTLLTNGAGVRVLVRRSSDAEQWRAEGADVRILQLDDRAALADALRGCAGFFTLLPFDLHVANLAEHAERLTCSIAGAVADAAVPHVVMLSSMGADLAEGTGPITGLNRLERALRETGTVLTALRSGHFQEKVADVIEIARESGVYPVFADSADTPVPMVATADLGSVAAGALQTPPDTSENLDILGASYSERAVAKLLGETLGRKLRVTTVPEEAWSAAFVEAGFRPHVADSLTELYRADAQGLLAPRGDRSVLVDIPMEATLAGMLAGR